MKLVIVGGVAGGANAAVRARRLDETAEIIVFERGAHVSFANCGLPYFIGGEIEDHEKLLVHTPTSLRERFNIDARILSEVTGIERQPSTGSRPYVMVKDRASGNVYTESYDHLILATGAAPIRPPLPGIESEGIFTLRDIADMDNIDRWIANQSAKSAVVVGGGYIGLEMTEQLHRRGLKVTVIEALPQIMTPMDAEMAELLAVELNNRGVNLLLGEPVTAFEQGAGKTITVITKTGRRESADLVIFGVGVKPESALAKGCGLRIGERGGISVDKYLATSDPAIWAIGDCIEVENPITHLTGTVALAGPANRQGRIVADNIILGRQHKYRGTLGTAIIKLFSLTAGCTGANERTLLQQNIPFEKIYLHPVSHASYYPGAESLEMKILFAPTTGKLLGAQIVGKAGVDKRIDVLATALHSGLTVDDLAELELAYSPPFSSAKDPVNMAGMIGQNIMRGLVQQAHWNDISRADNSTLFLDVRTEAERKRGFIPDSTHIPLHELRSRLTELPKQKEIIVYCQSGQRSYYACRILSQNGFRCKNLSGAYKTWQTATAHSAT